MLSLLAALVLAAQDPAAPAPACDFTGAARDWATRALTDWDRLERDRMGSPEPVRAALVLFDMTCQYELSPEPDGAFQAGGRRFRVMGHAHAGTISVTGGEAFPVGMTAFASPAENGRLPTFVIALPEVWGRFGGPTRDPTATFMGVFMHEFSHVQLMPVLEPVFARAMAAELPGADDAIQHAYASDPAYVTAYEQELAAFTAAATAPDGATARARLAEAWSLMTQRRTRWFADKPELAHADDVFLTLEGTGMWALYAYRRAADPAADPATLLAALRTRWWAQNEGLFIMAALDKVMPEWPRMAFGEGLTADALIRRALQESAPES